MKQYFEVPLLIVIDTNTPAEAEEIGRTMLDAGLRALEDLGEGGNVVPFSDIETYVMDARQVAP